jgi:hypothetical protein
MPLPRRAGAPGTCHACSRLSMPRLGRNVRAEFLSRMHHDDQNECRELTLGSIDEVGALEVLRALLVGALLVDGQGRVVFMNPTAADLVGNVIQRELFSRVEKQCQVRERARIDVK